MCGSLLDMETKRLNVNLPTERHRDFHLFAVSQGATMSDLVAQFVADEPVLQTLRDMVAEMWPEAKAKDLPIKPDMVLPNGLGGWIWEYRLPSGRRAKVVKTDNGIFLTH